MKPMLAHNLEKKRSHVKFPGIVQPKLDGVRCEYDGDKFYSRTEKPILGVPKLLTAVQEHFDDYKLDGEIFRRDLKFEDINSSVSRKVNILEDTSLEYWIYDTPRAFGFQNRWSIMYTQFEKDLNVRIKFCPTTAVLNWDQLEFYFAMYIRDGYEGLIYRNKDAEYEMDKRSNALLKYKQWFDMEVEIIGFDKGSGRLSETLGAMVCQLEDKGSKRLVKVGSGLTDEQRALIWCQPAKYINKRITIKYQELSKYGIPRFPTFLRFKEKGLE